MGAASMTFFLSREININGISFMNYVGSNSAAFPLLFNGNLPYGPFFIKDVSLIN